MDRPRLLLSILASALLAGFAAFAALAPAAQAGPNCTVDASVDSEEQAFLTLINDYRADNGLGPLALSPALNTAAAWKSQHMVDANYFAHDDVPIGRSWQDRIVDCGYNYPTWIGENIAAGYADAQSTFEQWRNSPPHNENMLSSHYNAIGIGRAYGASSTYGWYWTTDFGGYIDSAPAPTNTPPAPTSTPTNTPPAPTNTPANTPPPAPTATPPLAPAPTQTPVGPPPSATSGPPPAPTATRPLPPPAPRDPTGDVSCDDDTGSLDAALILQLDAHIVSALPCLDEGDVNGDGAVDAVDALIVLQYTAGLIASLPV